jgi:hypothetical protein
MPTLSRDPLTIWKLAAVTNLERKAAEAGRQ